MLGSQLVKLIGDNDSISFDSKMCDLRVQHAFETKVNNLWVESAIIPRHTTILHCAARVGGIQANTDFISDFFKDNVEINLNVLETAKSLGVKKLVSILSTCIYPDAAYVTYPLEEWMLHIGPPHNSNFGYAYAKRMLEAQSRAYRQQYGCNFVSVICNNLYGTNDNFDIDNSHVIPALIRRFYEAKLNNLTEVKCWGTGTPLREFTYAPDAAKIIKWVADNYNEQLPLNIGCTEEISIKTVTEMIAKEVGYTGDILWDTTKPDGQLRKPSSNKKLIEAGYKLDYTPIEVGLKETINWFKNNYPNVKGINR